MGKKKDAIYASQILDTRSVIDTPELDSKLVTNNTVNNVVELSQTRKSDTIGYEHWTESATLSVAGRRGSRSLVGRRGLSRISLGRRSPVSPGILGS